MKLDIKKWNAARIEIETSLKEQKSRRTESHQPRWTGYDECPFKDNKWIATRLYALRAHCRGRIHFEEQAAEADLEALLKEFALVEVAEEKAA